MSKRRTPIELIYVGKSRNAKRQIRIAIGKTPQRSKKSKSFKNKRLYYSKDVLGDEEWKNIAMILLPFLEQYKTSSDQRIRQKARETLEQKVVVPINLIIRDLKETMMYKFKYIDDVDKRLKDIIRTKRYAKDWTSWWELEKQYKNDIQNQQNQILIIDDIVKFIQ